MQRRRSPPEVDKEDTVRIVDSDFGEAFIVLERLLKICNWLNTCNHDYFVIVIVPALGL